MAFKMYGKVFSIVFQELFFSGKIKNSEALNFNINVFSKLLCLQMGHFLCKIDMLS